MPTATSATFCSRAARDVRRGLAKPQKELPSSYFYDTRGSELFEEISRLPEYSLTRAERGLLGDGVAAWVRRFAPASLVELGAGSGDKTRILLSAMVEAGRGLAYIPVDISGAFLRSAAEALGAAYPSLAIRPRVADFRAPLVLEEAPARPALFALLGSTIGNFAADEAVSVLRNVRSGMGSRDRFLLGVDLRPGPAKDVSILHAAYNDDVGVTRAFNLNILRHLNRVAGTDFDLSGFEHRAFYAETAGRIEMHLVATRPQLVSVAGGEPVEVARGESIRTEISCKYDRATVGDLFDRAGLAVGEWWEAEPGLCAVVSGRAV